MQGLILAAGMGKRLKDLTENNTKCMVKVNGQTLIERMLGQLDRLELSRIVIVVGYEGRKLIDYIDTLSIKTPVIYVDNPIYDKTNNIYSLWLARDYLLQEDTLLLESDLIFEDNVLKLLVDDPRDSLVLVDKYESWMDGTCIKIGENDSIEAFVPGKKFVFDDIPRYFKTVNIYKFSRDFSKSHYVPFLDAYLKALGNNEYYEQVLRVIALLDNPGIKAKRLDGQLWYEVDDIQDLDIASVMFAPDEDLKLKMMQARYGGYWRFPKMLDFCYLVNPYFPNRKLLDEIKANMDVLLTQYPSGMAVNSLIAARNFGVHSDEIVVGNGAAELIKCYMERVEGKVGFIKPTFEEYPNRYYKNESVVFSPNNADFYYTADDLMDFFGRNTVATVVLINPDNPSGNYIPKAEMLRFAAWCRQQDIRLVLDESFVDFSDEEDSSLIDREILKQYDKLIIIKSISKSYGIPGARLGIMVSADAELIADMKRRVGIWNINSFGEFYMQIAEKYKSAYKDSLKNIRISRDLFAEGLKRIPGVRLIPSQANYFLLELVNGMSAYELTKRLMADYNILIKDLSSKINFEGRQYVRVAIRNDFDNGQLLAALDEVLSL